MIIFPISEFRVCPLGRLTGERRRTMKTKVLKISFVALLSRVECALFLTTLLLVGIMQLRSVDVFVRHTLQTVISVLCCLFVERRYRNSSLCCNAEIIPYLSPIPLLHKYVCIHSASDNDRTSNSDNDRTPNSNNDRTSNSDNHRTSNK